MILLAACAPALATRYQPSAEERRAVRDEIGAMLVRAAANWNRGDLDAFVEDYLPGDTTTFIGSSGVLRGPTAIRAAYAPRFATGAVRDSLSFVLLDVDPLAPDVVNVIARYVLARRLGARDSVTAQGPTSLVMRRVDRRWRIVHDHSS
jgi:uncharacterized protein (TIGR02246 family)